MYCGKCGREANQGDCYCGFCGTALASSKPQESEEGIPHVVENIDDKQLQRCPKCQHTSLYWNPFHSLYECFNPRCKSEFGKADYLGLIGQQVQPEARTPYERQIVKQLRRCPHCGQGMLLWDKPKSSYRCLNVKCGHFYSQSQYRKWRLIGPVRRWLTSFLRSRWFVVALGLAIIFLGIGYYPSIFGQSDFSRWMEIPVEAFGAILVLVGLLVGATLGRVKIANTLLILLILFTIGSGAYSYLDKSGRIGAWVHRSSGAGTGSGNIEDKIPIHVTPTPTPTPTSRPTPTPTPTPSPTPAGINSHTGTYKNYYLGLAKTPEGALSGSECYGEFIVLINNKGAVNPTYSQLVNFLQQDKTDQFPYHYSGTIAGMYYGTAESHIDLARIQNIIDGTEQPNPPQVCADFAERLHNDAEIAGIRCAYVSVDLSGYTDPYHYGIPSTTGHALDAFQTTDRGLVYVDDTNSPGPTRSVTTVNVQVGQRYIPQSLFPESGWSSTYDSMGTVANILMIWDGNWNN